MAGSAQSTNKRLVTFGCSHTVGEYLPGWRHEYPVLEFSNQAWPFVLAYDMSVPVINNASGGESNHEMLLKILNFDYEPGDFVAVCWSYSGRNVLFDPAAPNSMHRTMDLLQRGQAWFYSVHTIHDLEIRNRQYIQHAELFLQSRNIPYQMSKIEVWAERNTNWRDYSHDDLPLFEITDRGSDNLHPGVDSHRQFATKLYNLIK